MQNKKLLVYTMAIGATYGLLPVAPDESVDYVCLTDREDIEPNGWTLQMVRPIIPSDPFRSSREFKICPHRRFRSYERSLFVDSNVQLLRPPTELWAYLIQSDEQVLGVFQHSFRKSLKQEFRKVRLGKFDYDAVLTEQMTYCHEFYPELMDRKPYWGGVLARRHMEQSCIDAMEVWYAHVLRFSRRDQLSLPIAMTHLNDAQKFVSENNISQTSYHRWPVDKLPKPAYRWVK